MIQEIKSAKLTVFTTKSEVAAQFLNEQTMLCLNIYLFFRYFWLKNNVLLTKEDRKKYYFWDIFILSLDERSV